MTDISVHFRLEGYEKVLANCSDLVKVHIDPHGCGLRPSSRIETREM